MKGPEGIDPLAPRQEGTGNGRTPALLAFMGLFALGAVLVVVGLVVDLSGNLIGVLLMLAGVCSLAAAPYGAARLSGHGRPWLALVIAAAGFAVFVGAGYRLTVATGDGRWHFASFSAAIGLGAGCSIRPPDRRALGTRAVVLSAFTLVTMFVPPGGPLIAFPILAAPAVLSADSGASWLLDGRGGRRAR
jgi:hypothetical protein